jgi:hypothetical protein
LSTTYATHEPTTAHANAGASGPVTITMQVASAMSGLSVRTLQRLTTAGQLETLKINGRRLVKVASLRQLLGEGGA